MGKTENGERQQFVSGIHARKNDSLRGEGRAKFFRPKAAQFLFYAGKLKKCGFIYLKGTFF